MSDINTCSICGRQYSMFEQYEPHKCNRTITKDELSLLEFANAMLKYWFDNNDHLFESEDGDDIIEKVMVPCGLVERVPYNPDIHGELDIDVGDEIWAWTDFVLKVRSK